MTEHLSYPTTTKQRWNSQSSVSLLFSLQTLMFTTDIYIKIDPEGSNQKINWRFSHLNWDLPWTQTAKRLVERSHANFSTLA